MFRLGEARHPGPCTVHHKGPVIGCINPTGLLGKSQLVAELPTGSSTIYAVSESHLTSPGRKKFCDELRFHNAGLALHAGAPVPARSQSVSAVGGKHRGVAFLSSVPGRMMTPTWKQEDWKQGRFHIASFAIGRRWVQGATIYGFAAAPDTQATKDATDQICQQATARLIDQSSGLRFIAGDFNQAHLSLDPMRHWDSFGWVNAQYWAYQKLGKPLQPTCKGVSIKDHLYLSPELAMYLEDVMVDPTFFKDHAVLVAAFSSLGAPPLMPMWKQPAMIDWNEVPELDNVESTFVGSPDDRFRHIMEAMENQVDQQLKNQHKPGLLQKQRGRGATFEVHWVSEHSRPPKHARQGERQPAFHGIDPTHALWLRQVRRLSNLVALLTRSEINGPQREHASQLWQSIIKSPGFPPNFPAWWNANHGSKAALTQAMPPLKVLKIISQEVDHNLTQMEKLLNKTRVAHAKQRRQDDPNLIFKDIKKEAPKPCQTLLHSCRARVVDIDEEELALVVDPPQQWDPAVELLGGEGKMDIIHAEPDKIWVDAIPPDIMGNPVHQDKYMGQLTDMFHEFGQEWSKRWDRHVDVDPQFWNPITDFVQLAFPPQTPMECPPITYDIWMAALKRKSKRSAVGPDGISRQDLIRMPRTLTEQLLKIFAEVEQGSSWPSQMLQGFIIALEKVENACAVQQYRPICIFSLCYRTWSSIRARQVIQHLAKMAPESCAGSLPHKSAIDIWFTILTSIELAHHTQEELSGAVVDLIKCFNMLPRLPIMAMMKHFGVAEPILRGWSMAQVHMKRRFKLRSCTGPALGSVTGFAEGCALSVTGMIAVNITAHRWLSLKHPSSTLFSYVDNLETISPSAKEALANLNDLFQFTDLMDVQIDTGKTYLWSSQTTGRKHFREQPDQAYTIMYWARDLGGHMTYSKQHTNRTLVNRLEVMPNLWNLLSRSLAPYSQKLRALKAKAWPLALHGSPATMLADNHFGTLRTGALRALREKSSGANPMLHLSAVEHPMHDPQFYVLVETVLTFRAHGPDVEVMDFIIDAHRTPYAFKQMPPGPCHVLISRLHQLGWAWICRGCFDDHMGLQIDVLTCPVQELKHRLLEAWQHRVLGIVQQRKTFAGAPFMHPGITTARMHTHPPEAQAVLRTALNGTFFTADRLAKRDPTASSNCRFCQAEDSQVHRQWLCPFFASCRTHLGADQIRTILEMPAVVANHAWLPEPPSLKLFREACLSIPDETHMFAWPSAVEDLIHLFTDGSCLAPSNMACKLASWGVVSWVASPT